MGLQLLNSQSWYLVYQKFHRANIEAPRSQFMYVIGEIAIPFLFESSIVSVFPSLNKPWNYAGYFRQIIKIGINSNNQDTYLPTRYHVDLNKITLLQLPLLTDYNLVFHPPEWIQELTLDIWVYIGEN